jgi:plasmid stabilization system protein ParE
LKPLRLREEARAEMLHEVQYYSGKQAGAGLRFQEAMRTAFNLMRRFPGSGAPGPAGTRRVKVKGFPFTVVYREETDQLVVFAIAPDRRQTGYWLKRVDGG